MTNARGKRLPIPPHARLAFKGKIFEVWQWEQELYDGSTATFERLRRPNTANVIAIVGELIMVQEQEQPDSGAFISIPGGRSDDGEDSLLAAKRELLEETGYVSDDWELFLETCPAAKIEWTVYTYIARNCRKVAEPDLDPGEKITTRLVSLEEFISLGVREDFSERDLQPHLLLAVSDNAKREEFRRRVFGRAENGVQ